MKDGDKVIWDSGFGYETCIFIEQLSGYVMFYDNPIRVRFLTGIARGEEGMVANREVFAYNEDNLKIVKEKYI